MPKKRPASKKKIPVKRPKPRTLKAPSSDTEVKSLILRALNRRGSPKIQIVKRVADIRLIRSMEGAQSIEVKLLDTHDGQLLNSGIFDIGKDRKLDTLAVTIDNLEYHLARLSHSANELTLTFEDKWVSQLRNRKGPVSWVRGGRKTRASFIRHLVNKLGAPPKLDIPGVHFVRPIAKPEKTDA